MKHLERLKKMISWAAKNEWIEKDPFKHYQLKFKRTERDYLSADELLSMETFDLTDPGMQTVRDLFIFSCYTGLSYVDLIELKKTKHHKRFNKAKQLCKRPRPRNSSTKFYSINGLGASSPTDNCRLIRIKK